MADNVKNPEAAPGGAQHEVSQNVDGQKTKKRTPRLKRGAKIPLGVQAGESRVPLQIDREIAAHFVRHQHWNPDDGRVLVGFYLRAPADGPFTFTDAQIAEAIGVTEGTASRAVQNLVREGLVLRVVQKHKGERDALYMLPSAAQFHSIQTAKEAVATARAAAKAVAAGAQLKKQEANVQLSDLATPDGVWSDWSTTCTDAGLKRPLTTDPDQQAAAKLAAFVAQGDLSPAELRQFLTRFAQDNSEPIVTQGHALRLLPDLLPRYRT